ncbi:protein of unknown function [Methylocaldum szegediense]|uniref:Uncharacterized protein n=1 Tax=Methylocaldum szegediense TaxID=73780 RepID=A0ABN8X7Z8_9GAMM|nr:protein of unknown function [Methylocaldum szegediense]
MVVLQEKASDGRNYPARGIQSIEKEGEESYLPARGRSSPRPKVRAGRGRMADCCRFMTSR